MAGTLAAGASTLVGASEPIKPFGISDITYTVKDNKQSASWSFTNHNGKITEHGVSCYFIDHRRAHDFTNIAEAVADLTELQLQA